MREQQIIKKRRGAAHSRKARHIVATAFTPPMAGGAAVSFAYPGMDTIEADDGKRTLVTSSLAALLHLSLLGILIYLASLAPIPEVLIPVQLLHETPETPDTPAPAPKALAERRMANFSPQIQSVAPQIINPRVIAEASPVITAEALEMDALDTARAPTRIDRQSMNAQRVERIDSIVAARVQAVDIPSAQSSAVRGPVKIHAPALPSAGPRRIDVATPVKSMGTSTMAIGSGSSVREGIASSRDVLGSPTGDVLFSVDTAVGDGYLAGTGGTGTGRGPYATDPGELACHQRPEVLGYLDSIRIRTLDLWALPPGTRQGVVKLRFRVDVAGSASGVEFIHAENNALGVSAVDAMRAASPFPPMPEKVRCLANQNITATFKESTGAG